MGTMRQPQKKRPTGRRPAAKRSTARKKRAYSLVINYAECWNNPDEALNMAKALQQALKKSGWETNLETADDWDDYEKKMSAAIRRRPFAVVIVGGDGSVRMAAARAYRAKRLIGILPCGMYNNIFHSLYGHTDPELAIDIIKEGHQTRIDAGLANGTFFLGSLAAGVVPAMMEKIGEKKLPRMAMTWSKIAGKAVDETMPRTTVVKVDTYTFETQPLILHIHLLSHLMSLRFAPAAATDDGRLILVYDKKGNRDVISHYIRDLKKDKYQYNDGIQMIRGHKISISPSDGRIWLMDSEPVEFTGNEITIEVINKALRIFGNKSKEKK